MVKELTNLVEEKEELCEWQETPAETVKEYFGKPRTMEATVHKVSGTILGNYFYRDNTRLRFHDGLEVTIPHEINSTKYYDCIESAKRDGSAITVGIIARGFSATPVVRYFEYQKIKEIIPFR